MKIQNLVKLGVSRQVVIPKRIHDHLKLSAGDYLEVGLEGFRVVLTPKTVVDKYINARLNEGLTDIAHGKIYGPFSSSKELLNSLHERITKTRKVHARRVH